MALEGFLKQDGSSRLASVGAPGKQRKRIESPGPKAPSPAHFKTRICLSHEKPHPVVPVVILEYDAKTQSNVESGLVALACPLCWKVLRWKKAP